MKGLGKLILVGVVVYILRETDTWPLLKRLMGGEDETLLK